MAEFITTSLENQLVVELGDAEVAPPHSRPNEAANHPAIPDVLRAIDADLPTAPKDVSYAWPLYSLTNRLFPLKVSARALGNSSKCSLEEFHERSSQAARWLGTNLRDADVERKAKGAARRWIALPVGDDQRAALDRYVNHFTVFVGTDNRAHGALAQLGLAGLTANGEVRLTEEGLQFARLENAAIDDSVYTDQPLLNEDERAAMFVALKSNASERERIAEFVRCVHEADGIQDRVDAGIAEAHSDWSSPQVVAHRAAMLGRLRDIGCASSEGSGAKAVLKLDDAIEMIIGE